MNNHNHINNNPVDELEKAFEACLSVPTEDPKSSAELNITRFIEAARKLEVFFLRKQLLLSDNDEGHDDLSKLRSQIAAREQILAKYKQKIEDWKKIID